MANPDHLKILEQGVKVWNKWRKENRHEAPDLSGIIRKDTSLQGIDLTDCNLSHADFTGTNLNNASFRNADLVNANLWYAKLDSAILSKAMLYGTIFVSTNLKKADFDEAKLYYTIFDNVDFTEIKNLESIKHEGPSIITVRTIYQSHNSIPEKFLRGCGLPESFITHISSLIAAIQPIQFYSCFISYSSKDEEFVKRLYNDLQSEGVRCWFAPEDLKIGEKLRVRIDEAVRLHDKLLLILSKNSVASQWVEKEVETAFEKEAKQKKTVLFPVRLDDAVMKKKTGWAADIRKSRHIGDFSDWKNHDSYKKAFERLMRDLKAGEKR
jgi:TIR domain/Pentapeptide repeats (8 copies)